MRALLKGSVYSELDEPTVERNPLAEMELYQQINERLVRSPACLSHIGSLVSDSVIRYSILKMGTLQNNETFRSIWKGHESFKNLSVAGAIELAFSLGLAVIMVKDRLTGGA